jgi:hypothetical protein
MFRGLSPLGRLSTPDPEEERAYEEWMKQQEGGGEAGLSPWQRRRVRCDRERMRVAMEGFARSVSAFTPGPKEAEPAVAPWNWRRRPSQRQLRKARQALERFAAQFEEELSNGNGPDQAGAPQSEPADRQAAAANSDQTNKPGERSGPGGPSASPSA